MIWIELFHPISQVTIAPYSLFQAEATASDLQKQVKALEQRLEETSHNLTETALRVKGLEEEKAGAERRSCEAKQVRPPFQML